MKNDTAESKGVVAEPWQECVAGAAFSEMASTSSRAALRATFLCLTGYRKRVVQTFLPAFWVGAPLGKGRKNVCLTLGYGIFQAVANPSIGQQDSGAFWRESSVGEVHSAAFWRVSRFGKVHRGAFWRVSRFGEVHRGAFWRVSRFGEVHRGAFWRVSRFGEVHRGVFWRVSRFGEVHRGAFWRVSTLGQVHSGAFWRASTLD